MMYEVEVRPGPTSGFFQYYTEVVEAPTSQDAESRVRRANPGCVVRTTKSWSEYDNEDNSSSGGDIDGAGLLGLLLIVFMIAAWKYLLIFGAIGLVTWLIIKYSQE